MRHLGRHSLALRQKSHSGFGNRSAVIPDLRQKRHWECRSLVLRQKRHLGFRFD